MGFLFAVEQTTSIDPTKDNTIKGTKIFIPANAFPFKEFSLSELEKQLNN